MSSIVTNQKPLALSSLTDDEKMFQEAVRDFATSEVAPLVKAMDEEQTMRPELISQLFELGLMGKAGNWAALSPWLSFEAGRGRANWLAQKLLVTGNKRLG